MKKVVIERFTGKIGNFIFNDEIAIMDDSGFIIAVIMSSSVKNWGGELVTILDGYRYDCGKFAPALMVSANPSGFEKKVFSLLGIKIVEVHEAVKAFYMSLLKPQW